MHSNRLQIWIVIDQLLNALLWGWSDETLSARAWRCRFKKSRWMWAVRIINCVVFWQDNHCQSAYQSEKLQRHIAPEYRSEKGQ
ncbi:MAG: hypothetical protein B7X95_01375 [Methylophilaceae bacterium 17-44-8]|nr:MAG: hypothetical protein B7X95_01375 [Methylophilaceae bacterium 17-44-8]